MNYPVGTALIRGSSCPRSTSRVNWSLIQPFLLDCASDVLLLCDTCFAGKAGKSTSGSTSGSKEVISACNDSSLAPGVSRLSFTRVLTRVLKNFAERHRLYNDSLTAATLTAHLVNHYFGPELKKRPHYDSLVEYQSDSCSIFPAAGSENRFLGDTLCLPPKDLGPITVMVAVDLYDSPPDDLRNFVAWLQGRGLPPQCLENIQSVQLEAIRGVESIYASDSTLLLLRVPLAVWYCLPPNIGCRYVGLLRSGNLLTTSTSRIGEVELPKPDTRTSFPHPEAETAPMTTVKPSRPTSGDDSLASPSNFSKSLPMNTEEARISSNQSNRLNPSPYGSSAPPKVHSTVCYCHICKDGPRLVALSPLCTNCNHQACPKCTFKKW